VVENDQYDGCLETVRKSFKDHLADLVKDTLSPERLVIKKVNGENITCKDLLNYFEAYTKIYQSNEIPEPRTALEATAEANNINVKEEALRRYMTQMERLTHGAYIYEDKFLELHHKHKEDSVLFFNKAKKLGGKEFSLKYQLELIESIDKAYENFKKVNDTKGSLAAIKTPVALSLLLFITYLLSHFWVDLILDMLWLSKLAVFLDLVFYAVFIGILSYMLCKVTHVENQAIKDLIRQLDIFSELIWVNGFVRIGAALDAMGISPAKLLAMYARQQTR